MKKIFVAATALLLSATVFVQAQRQTGQKRHSPSITAEMLAERKVAHLEKQVKLTEDQKNKVYIIYKEVGAQRIAAKGDAQKSITEMNKVEKERVSKVLSPEQRAVLIEKEEAHIQKMKERTAERERNLEIKKRNLKADLEKE